MFVDILKNVLWQVGIFIGAVYLVGFIISIINRVFYKMFNYSKLVVYGTGLFGTPIHELSHLLMCLLFMHKVEKVKFFQINDDDGVLGYVSHSWNRKNVWQQIGNYFIGVAPIAVGTLIIYLGMLIFLPATYAEMSAYFTDLATFNGNLADVNLLGYSFRLFAGMMKALFAEISIGWPWWVFMFVSLCIAIHMNLSGADIKGSLVAIPLMVIIILAVNLVIGLIPFGVYDVFLGVVSNLESFLISTLILALVLSAMCLVVGFIIKGSFLLIKKIFHIR
ncbi:MAG: hypothetical protein J6V66_07340 [Clostridia bacterium]|nr:hypothetical protein [Clostridia bacterium]